MQMQTVAESKATQSRTPSSRATKAADAVNPINTTRNTPALRSHARVTQPTGLARANSPGVRNRTGQVESTLSSCAREHDGLPAFNRQASA